MSSVTVSELWPKAAKLEFDIQSNIGLVQRGDKTPDEVWIRVEELQHQLTQLETLIAAEPVGRREQWRMRLNNLGTALAGDRSELERFTQCTNRRAIEQREREELLRNRRVNSTQFGWQHDHHSDMQRAADTSDSLSSSMNMVGGYIAQSQASLAELIDQKSRMKAAHRRILNMAESLGVSNSVLRVIERTDFIDRLVVFGGMFVVTIVLWIAWRCMGR